MPREPSARTTRRAGMLLAVLCVLVGCSPPPASRPNVVLIVVDTLRADRLSCREESRPISPRLCELVADRGVVFDRAYAQAPWTLPSMASLLTGLFPDELGFAGSTLYDVPEGVPTLAERLREAGYRTAAFVANPTLQADSGFARGFDRFEIAAPEIASLSLNAEDQLQPWLDEWIAEVDDDAPWFLWAHYLDPHDPYLNPDIEAGEGFPNSYEGGLTGNDVHGVYAGAIEVEPRSAARQLAGLYDSEVRYVDRFVVSLLERLEAAGAGDTLVVLTSDHGEELGEHGGWKHGQTLYEEQVRIPLWFRWPGSIDAGRRVEGTVRLADVVPTVLDAVGVEAPELTGQTLLPVLRGERGPAARPAFFQHLSSGPLRAGAVLGDRKVVLFNDRDERPESDPLGRHLELLDRRRLPGVAVFDLGADPLEQRPRDHLDPSEAGLERVVHRRLLGTVPGVRVLAGGLDEGEAVFEIELDREPAVVPYFLGPGDGWRSFESPGGWTVELRVRASRGAPLGGVVLESAEIVGVRGAEGWSVRLGSGSAVGLPIESPRGFEVRDWAPDRPGMPTLLIFAPDRDPESSRVDGPSEAVRERLKTLGYVD